MVQVLKMAKGRGLAGTVMAGAVLAFVAQVAVAQSEEHGRKFKPLPPTSHIVVTVLKGFNGKPLQNAAVVFHAVREGKNDGNLEVKTDPEGKATIDVIELGSHLTVQVIASGFATSATEMDVDGPSKELQVKLLRPREQVSTYQDTDGKASQEKPGVQEPPPNVVPKKSGTISPPTNTDQTTAKKSQFQSNPTQLPGPLNAPPGTVEVPTQPGAPVTVPPPTAPVQTGQPTLPPQPQEI